MDKILSKDTIKNVFSALGAKTSDSNYGVALLDKTSGEPKGFMGMSDLASVLDGLITTIPGSSNLDTYSTSGKYFIGNSTVANTITGTPISNGGPFYLKVDEIGDSGWRLQTLLYHYNSYRTFYRTGYASGSSMVWGNWIEDYNTTLLTNSSALSPLATALGVDSEIMHDVYDNFNDVITPCRMLLLPGAQTYTNAPSQFTGNTTEGILVVFPFTTNVSNPRIGQLILSNKGFFMRFKSSGGWTGWMQVANA